MKIVDKVSWPVADLRCDWTADCPIEAVATAWQITSRTWRPKSSALWIRARRHPTTFRAINRPRPTETPAARMAATAEIACKVQWSPAKEIIMLE